MLLPKTTVSVSETGLSISREKPTLQQVDFESGSQPFQFHRFLIADVLTQLTGRQLAVTANQIQKEQLSCFLKVSPVLQVLLDSLLSAFFEVPA